MTERVKASFVHSIFPAVVTHKISALHAELKVGPAIQTQCTSSQIQRIYKSPHGPLFVHSPDYVNGQQTFPYITLQQRISNRWCSHHVQAKKPQSTALWPEDCCGGFCFTDGRQ